MAKENDPKGNEIPFHPEMRAAVEASQDLPAGDICERIEDIADEIIRQWCAKKQFEQTSSNCSDKCQTVEEPKIVPCIRLKWGDGPQDHLETDDTEVLLYYGLQSLLKRGAEEFQRTTFPLDRSRRTDSKSGGRYAVSNG
jgi:hypothetical protein